MTQLLVERPASAGRPYDVQVAVERTGPHLLARLAGRLDQRTATGVVRQVRSWADDGARAVVIDLAGVTALDGHGLAALLRCRRVVRARAGVLAVRHAPRDAEPTLRRSGLLMPESVMFDVP